MAAASWSTVFALLACLAASALAARPCDDAPLQGSPVCDPTQSLDARAQYIVSQLKDAEKICLLTNGACGVSRLNLPQYQWWNEALHGCGHSPGVHFGGPIPYATSFPQVCLTAASFNKTLFHAIGSTISTEARAMSNQGQAGLTYWAPNINIFRDPRWGRGQETPGEDPFLASAYASNFVKGMQEGEDLSHLKVSSCCKHYFDYNLENWHGTDRHHFNAITTDQDLADTYLPAFEACVVEGKASSLMCSYNAVNGVPSCANEKYMQVVARSTWGFQGYITSDCGAVDDVFSAHHYTPTTDATCAQTLGSGMDIECGSFLQKHLAAAMVSGAVTESVVDDALLNLFRVQLRLGMFDPVASQPYLTYNYKDKINTPEHQQLALDAARQGIVLLKNNNKRLPLAGSLSLAALGPNANATGTMQGNYAGTAPFLITPVDGLSKYSPSVTFVQGCTVACPTSAGFASAVTAATAADVVVLVLGLDQGQESEGHDRDSIALPGQQQALLDAVTAAAKQPIILVVMAGGPVDLASAKNSDKVGAILWVGYPGQAGGQAIADVIYGTINPGGRLTTTVYPAVYTSQTSMFNVDMRPDNSSGYPGRTYRFYTGEPVYTFGDGLSYTTFSYTTPHASVSVPLTNISTYAMHARATPAARVTAPTVAWVTYTVTNTGSVAGSDVVLFFIQSPTPGAGGAPVKTLAGFERVYLEPGQSIDVPFAVSAHSLTLADRNGDAQAQGGVWRALVGQPTALVTEILVQ